MKTCPYCAEEIQDAAVRCRWCGSDLSAAGSAAPGVSSAASTAPAGSDAPVPPAAPTFTQSGRRYLLGYGADYYGIWDQHAPGPPLHRFPADDAGWEGAWRQYCRSEAGVLPAPRRPIIGQPIPGSLSDVAAEVAARGRRLIAALGPSPSPVGPPPDRPPADVAISAPIEPAVFPAQAPTEPTVEPTPATQPTPAAAEGPTAPAISAQPSEASPAAERHCRKCGRANPVGNRFCESCGSAL